MDGRSEAEGSGGLKEGRVELDRSGTVITVKLCWGLCRGLASSWSLMRRDDINVFLDVNGCAVSWVKIWVQFGAVQLVQCRTGAIVWEKRTTAPPPTATYTRDALTL